MAPRARAAGQLRVINEERPSGKGYWVPDDRFIAAVYTLSRSEPQFNERLPLNVIVKAPGRVLLCIATED